MRAVLFDMDGTITRPVLDFDAIRAEIGIAPEPILEAMERMSAAARARAETILLRYEAAAAAQSELSDGAAETVRTLAAHGIATALLTRNSRASVRTVLEKHGLSFGHVYTREDGPLNPSPEPVLAICRALDVPPSATLMVGDYLFDILAGQAAGARTALVIHDGPPPAYADQADHVIRRLAEVLTICGVGGEDADGAEPG